MSRYFNVNALTVLGNGEKKPFNVRSHGALDGQIRTPERFYVLDEVLLVINRAATTLVTGGKDIPKMGAGMPVLGEPSFKMQNRKVLDMRFPYTLSGDEACEPGDIARLEFQVLMVPCSYLEDGCRNLVEKIRSGIVQYNPEPHVPDNSLKDGAILNLTLHKPSRDQTDVINGPAEVRKEIVDLLTFEKLPEADDIRRRARRLAEIASRQNLYGKNIRKRVMLGCAMYLAYPLTQCLLEAGIEIKHSFTDRVVVETEVDGKIETRRISKHQGFVGLVRA